MLEKGGDTLDAIIEVIRGPEEDPNDDSVGYGGLPNEEGVVELDSCCMHGPTRLAGSVGGVQDIMHVALLAKTVMEHTGHVMLVGEGAKRFGVAHGFPTMNLLTEHSRKVWLLWKETMSNQDWWGPGPASPNFKFPTAGTKSEDLQAAHPRDGKAGGETGDRAGAADGSDSPGALSADGNDQLFGVEVER